MPYRPPPPRGYKYDPVTYKLVKNVKPVTTLGRRRRRRKTGGRLDVKRIKRLISKVRGLATKKNYAKLKQFLR